MTSLKPTETEPKEWTHFSLWKKVKETLNDLPSHFEATISISGIPATDIFALGALMGAAIEDNVVRALNNLRDQWDPENKYADCEFKRQAEVFPDVRFQNTDTGEILMGIELKGWYLLSKEMEPSFRFRVTPAVCAPQDLLVIFPWALENVLSGRPQIFKPYVKPARFVAEYRNYWWQHKRQTEDSIEIKIPKVEKFYPEGRESIEDKPAYDAGNNFGRIARTEIMDDFVDNCGKIVLSGIEVGTWQEFLKATRKSQKTLKLS